MEKTMAEMIKAENKNMNEALANISKTRLNESIKAQFGIDLSNKDKFNFDSPLFSWNKFREGAYEMIGKLKEANSETSFGQLLRAGINNIANNWYVLTPTVYEQICSMTVSNKLVELYAPLHRGQVPKRVERGEEFKETKIVGADRQIVNQKFGMLFSVERELIDDDMTGQILQRARDGGENMKLVESAYSAQRFIGVAGSYGGEAIPASTLSTVWSTTLTAGDGTTSNRLTAYASFSVPNLQALDNLLMNMKDLNGNKILVQPDILYVGTALKFPASQAMNSSWFPASAPLNIAGTATSTNVGTMGAYNVMQGIYTVVVDRFLPQKAYAVGQSGRGPVFQRRDPLEVVQENPQSGPAFSQDVFRFKTRSRWEVDWIESPRFWALGSDGSI
jgi:hypothetical protein